MPRAHTLRGSAAGQLFDAMLEGFQLLRCDLDRHLLPNKREPEKLAASGLPHAALLLVHHELQLLREKTLHRNKDSLGTTVALHEDHEVVRIADETQTSAFQFLVQVVQQDVGQHG
jgi:hypothetical protein